MRNPYRLRWVNRLARRIIRPLFRAVFSIISRVEVSGGSNMPAHGPYVIIFNHVSLYEAPLLVSFLPCEPEILGASDVWSRPGQSLLARLYGGIPIRRGEVDRSAMYAMIDVLEAGKPLLIAPEGGRSHQPGMRQAKSGLIFVIEKMNVPIVPVALVGVKDHFLKEALQFRRPKAIITIGKPFLIPQVEEATGSAGEIRQRKVDAIMKVLATYLPDEYRGYYR